ncbi:MAG: patatin-like phospholipase family protein [Candidatus Omnitrophota bacterium]
MQDLMDIKEIKFILSNIFPFSKLKEKEIDEFISIAGLKEYRNTEIIYSEGDKPDCFNLLLRGRVLVLTREKSRDSEIEILKRGTNFGIISLFTDEPHSVTTKSIENSIILRVGKKQFREFLEKHPSISLDFTRMLSQRVKRRVQPKKIFQSKRIAILGAPSSGKSTYMYNLGLKLKEQTKKKVVCLELSLKKDIFTLASFLNKKHKVQKLSEFKEESIGKFIIKGDIDYLLVKIDKRQHLVSLLNLLSESYHFILYEFPFSFWDIDFHEFLAPAHYIHLLISSRAQILEKVNLLMRKLKQKESLGQEKIKIIINDFTESEKLSPEEESKIIDYPIYATIPSYKDEAYFKALNRIAREIGEVVTGLALGSGAAYGFAHVGVLKVLEENNIPIDIISGTSMGALIAAMWAAGFTIEDIEKQILDLGRKFSLFHLPGIALPFKGMLKSRRLEKIFKGIFKDKTFYDLKYNLKIVAFDFIKRKTKILDKGLLYKAIAASCAMPGIFEPVKVEKDILLDGGILKPLPTKILLNHGANKIIAINITPSNKEVYAEYRKRTRLHIFDFIFGSIETMQQEFVRQAMKISDVVIHPHFEGLGWMEFEKVSEFIKRGEEATREKIEEIKSLVSS